MVLTAVQAAADREQRLERRDAADVLRAMLAVVRICDQLEPRLAELCLAMAHRLMTRRQEERRAR